MLELSIPFLIIGFSFFIASLIGYSVVTLPPNFGSYVSDNLELPIGSICLVISIIFAAIGLVISYHFLILLFLIMAAIGYVLSIKMIPSWVESLDQKSIEEISESILFPYYSTIIMMVIWPLLIIGKAMSKVLTPVFSIIQFRIETPNSALKRKLDEIEKD